MSRLPFWCSLHGERTEGGLLVRWIGHWEAGYWDWLLIVVGGLLVVSQCHFTRARTRILLPGRSPV